MQTIDNIKKGLACHAQDRSYMLPCSDCDYHGQGLPHCRKAVHEDASAMLEQLAAQVPKWISVEERLPEYTGYFLCYVERYDVIDVIHYSARNKAFNAWDENFSPDCVIAVTHWMPLPEPPKEET